MPKATVTKNTFWTKAKQHKRFYFADGTQNSADGKRNPTGCSSLPSLPPHIYMRACVCTKQQCPEEILLWVSPLWTTSHCPVLQQERSCQGRVPGRDSGSTCVFMALPLTCDMPLDRQVWSFFFPCHAQSFILILDPQGGDCSSLWLLRLVPCWCSSLQLLFPRKC